MAPGTRALAFASRWFDPAIVHRTFEPLIADWQREWYESASSRRAWVSARAWTAFLCSVAISSPGILATPMPRSISTRVVRRVALFCLLVGGALSIPMVRSIGARWLDAPPWAPLLLMALPAALTIAFPFAMVIGVDAIRRAGDAPKYVERAAAAKLGLFAMLLMLTISGFVIPLANQTFRELATPPGWNVPPPPIRHQSTFALLTHPERTAAIVATPHYSRAGAIRRELLQRVVAGVMPLLFVWLRWSSLSRRTRTRLWPLPTWAMTTAVVGVYFATFFLAAMLEIEWGLLPGTGLVLPLALFSLWALLEQRLGQRATESAAA